VNTKSIVQTIHYILNRIGCTDKLKIVKLVYFADKLHLLLYGRTITGDSYCAMKNGPVGSTTLDVLNENLEYLDEEDINYSKLYLIRTGSDSRIYEPLTIQNCKYEMLSESDKKILDTILDKFARKTGKELVDLTHRYPEWKQYENDFANEVKKHADIDTVELFSVIQNDPLDVDPKRAEISREMFCGCE
jgi:uncharacterized phage-associated protein